MSSILSGQGDIINYTIVLLGQGDKKQIHFILHTSNKLQDIPEDVGIAGADTADQIQSPMKIK